MSARKWWEGGGGRSTPKRRGCQLYSDSELDIIFKPALSSEWTHQCDGVLRITALYRQVTSREGRDGLTPRQSVIYKVPWTRAQS